MGVNQSHSAKLKQPREPFDWLSHGGRGRVEGAILFVGFEERKTLRNPKNCDRSKFESPQITFFVVASSGASGWAPNKDHLLMFQSPVRELSFAFFALPAEDAHFGPASRPSYKRNGRKSGISLAFF